MPPFRFARLGLMIAALGLNATPALLAGVHAADKPAAPAVEAPKDTVRAELYKLIDPAAIKDLIGAKKYTEVQQRIAAADAFPGKTPFEAYVLERIRLLHASATGNDAQTVKALEACIDSGRLTAEEKNEFVLVLASHHYRAKRYPMAITLLIQYQKDSPTPVKARAMLAQSYYFSGDYASAKAPLQEAVAAAEAAGKTPDIDDLRLLGSAAGKTKDSATATVTLEKLVRFYPSDDYWTDLIDNLVRRPAFNQRHELDVLRLKDMVIKVMAPEEYTDMAELGVAAGQYAEAKHAMDKGYAAGVLGSGSNAVQHKQLRDKTNKGAADDAKNIGSGEAGALKAKDGLPLVNLGYAFVTMDQFDKGLALMEQGIAKGVAKRPEDAKLHLGVAYAKAGRKDEALKAFASVKGDDGLTELAKLWTMWLNQPVKAAATAAPAPAPAAK